MNKTNLVGAHLTANGGNKLVVADNTVAVFVEIFEDALKFGNIELHTELAENPLDFVAVKDAVTVLVHLDEKLGEDANATLTLALKASENLIQNLVWGFSVGAKDRVNIRVVAGAADGDHSSHLLVVNLAGAIGVE